MRRAAQGISQKQQQQSIPFFVDTIEKPYNWQQLRGRHGS